MLAAVVGSTAVIGAVVYWALESYAEGRFHLGKSGEPDKLSFREGLKFVRENIGGKNEDLELDDICSNGGYSDRRISGRMFAGGYGAILR